MSLKGKNALVTGASRGIGKAIAMRLAADGATVAVHYGRARDVAEDTVRAIESAGGKAFAVGADLAVIGEIDAMFATLDQRMETIDILVNNAGTLHMGCIEDVTPEIFDNVVSTNLRGTYFVTKNALERMPDGGRIISISSNGTRIAYPETSVYGLTKAGVENLTLSLAQQLGARGITVNAIRPGIIATEMTAGFLSEEVMQAVYGMTALGKLATVEDLAEVASLLASPQNSAITAQLIEVSGGCRL